MPLPMAADEFCTSLCFKSRHQLPPRWLEKSQQAFIDCHDHRYSFFNHYRSIRAQERIYNRGEPSFWDQGNSLSNGQVKSGPFTLAGRGIRWPGLYAIKSVRAFTVLASAADASLAEDWWPDGIRTQSIPMARATSRSCRVSPTSRSVSAG
jgi:hypothetical protein